MEYKHNEIVNSDCTGEVRYIESYASNDCHWDTYICTKCGKRMETPVKGLGKTPHHWAREINVPQQHTLGPWRPGKDYGSIVTDSSEGIGQLDDGNLKFYGGNVIAETVAPCNMPLICAAPELLEALKRLLSGINNPNPDATDEVAVAEEMAKAAVAKAEGRG